MNKRGVRVALVVVGFLALGTGAVWVGQGLGFIPGSFMSGDRTWFNIGLIVALVGVVLVLLGARRPRDSADR